MKIKSTLGWIALIAISLAPVFLWLYLGVGFEGLTDYKSITHGMGELFGLIGMTMFALTFILSTRITFIEDIFGGLDKVYIAHGILGGSALISILAHPIFLVIKFIPKEINLAAEYLLPSSYWSANFGIISLVGMIVLMFITLFTKMKYNRWKFTHEFFGLMFIFAVLHIFLVRNSIAQDNIFSGYYIYATIVSVIGIFGFSYSLFIKNRLFKNAIYSIKSIIKKDDLFEITITPEHKPISYKAGQFIFIRFYNKNISKESHPFSIASKSNSNDIIIVAKNLGDYTKKLVHLNVGDKVSIEGPYGRFNYKKHSEKNQIWIAAGIGITPFIGMAQDVMNDNKLKSNITLIYLIKNKDDLIAKSLFEDISKKSSKFNFIPWVSEEKGRITIKDIYSINNKFHNSEFFLCGPTRFKENLIKNLIKNNIKKDNIHEEAFDFR